MHQYVGVMGLLMVMIARLGPEGLLPLPKVLVGIKKEKAFISEGLGYYSTVTDFARFLGWSTLQPLITAM
jgi:hypothetical protein